jgi:hypothetical protein
VAGFSRTVRLLDPTTWEQAGAIQDIEYPPLTMDAWLPPSRRAAGGMKAILLRR